MKKNIYDVIIIGGGPIGLACGIQAKKAAIPVLPVYTPEEFLDEYSFL